MFIGQHPKDRRQILGPFHRNQNMLLVSLHLGLLGNFFGQSHDVELFQFELVHVAFQFGNRIQIVDDVD